MSVLIRFFLAILIVTFFVEQEFTWASVKTGSYRDGEWEVGGFVDLRFREGDLDKEVKGFAVNDGAFKVFGQLNGQMELLLDIPFGWIGPQDLDATAGNETFDNTWGLAENRAQAYFKYKREKWNLLGGQFDSPLGFESNDSIDLNFANPGLNFVALTPATHVGIKGEYKLNPSMEVHAIISNPGGQGSYGNEQPEYALQFLYQSTELSTNYYIKPGVYTLKSQGESYTLIDIFMGTTSRIVDLHVEFNKASHPSFAEDPIGFMLLSNWKVKLNFMIGIRAEFLRNTIFNGINVEDAQQVSFSANYTFSEWLSFRADLTTRQLKDDTGAKMDGEQINFILFHRL